MSFENCLLDRKRFYNDLLLNKDFWGRCHVLPFSQDSPCMKYFILSVFFVTETNLNQHLTEGRRRILPERDF